MRFFSPPDPFRRTEAGELRFHPTGRLGPAYVVGDEALERRLALAARLHWLGSLASLGFFLVWLTSHRGPDPLMYIAPPLLVYLLVWFAYRMALRALLRGASPAPNLWRARADGDANDSGERP